MRYIPHRISEDLALSCWKRQWHPTPVLLPGKSHGQRSLVGCSPCGRYESDMTERLHFSLSHIGEGNGNPLQCSCLEIPGMGEPGGLPSMGSHRVRHDWSDLAAAALLAHSNSSHWYTGSLAPVSPSPHTPNFISWGHLFSKLLRPKFSF